MGTWGNTYRRMKGTTRIILLLLFFSCDTSGNKEKANDESKSVKLEFETTRYEKTQTGCTGGECASFIASYPVFDPADEWNVAVNELVDDKIRTIAADFIMKGTPKESIEALAEGFVTSYQEFQVDFPESQTGWYFKLEAKLAYKGKTFSCIQFDTDTYTGGAHPISNRQYMLISTDGVQLEKYEDFVISMPKLRDLAEDHFRQTQGIKPGQTLSEAGYMFTNDVFALPENFGFTKSGMILFYNPYEVADYSKGSIEISIPFSQLKSIYKHKAL